MIMTDVSDARSETLARMAASRAEIRRLLEPHPVSSDPSAGPGEGGAFFPRSRTMRVLMSGRGLGTIGAVVSGLLVARPALALRLLRLLPVGAVARIVLVKAIASMRGRRE